jgi:uncharacterized protein YqjF (DUF2071 family)
MNQPSLASRLALRERPQRGLLVMFQKWRDLLFLHWEYEAGRIQRTLPQGLHVDTFEGKAYVGLVPFFMKNVQPRFLPSVPGISNFMETNVRTYVYDDQGVAGVWFYSLDANQWLAVQLARKFFKLPYFYARMQSRREKDSREINYSTWRRGADERLRSHFRYQSRGIVRTAEPGSLEFFLVERYVLFAYDEKRKKLFTGRVHHRPYPIFEADVPEWDTHLLELDGFEKPGRTPDHMLMSAGVEVEVFAVERS